MFSSGNACQQVYPITVRWHTPVTRLVLKSHTQFNISFKHCLDLLLSSLMACRYPELGFNHRHDRDSSVYHCAILTIWYLTALNIASFSLCNAQKPEVVRQNLRKRWMRSSISAEACAGGCRRSHDFTWKIGLSLFPRLWARCRGGSRWTRFAGKVRSLCTTTDSECSCCR